METLLNELLKAFGWSILNSIWQSGVIYCILIIILSLSTKLSAKTRHNLAFAAICAMCTWFLITFFNYLDFQKTTITAANQQQLKVLNSYLTALPLSLTEKIETYFPFLATIYGLGISIQIILVARGYLIIHKLKNNSLTAVPSEWNAKFLTIANTLKIIKPIKFHISSLVNVPIVVGYLKPVVLFPVSLVANLDIEQVEAILIHELSHIRRNDYLLNLIKTTIETILFFNPFVWLTGKHIHIEREHACDDLVLSLSGKPLSYAHALLKLELINEKFVPAYSLSATGKTQYLYQRIKRITNMKTNYFNTRQQLIALFIAIAGLMSIAWVSPEVKEKAKKFSNQISKSEIFQFVSEFPTNELKTMTVSDTTKKKQKIKITITDNNGAKKEYNSIEELPDSIKLVNKIFINGKTFGVRFNDSLSSRRDSAKIANFTTLAGFKFNSPNALVLKNGKLEELGSEAYLKLIQTEGFKRLTGKSLHSSLAVKIISADSLIKKITVNGSDIKKGQDLSVVYLNNLAKTKGLELKTDSIVINGVGFNENTLLTLSSMLTGKTSSFTQTFKNSFTVESKDLANNAEYKKLKEKFDKDVAELKKKELEKKVKITMDN